MRKAFLVLLVMACLAVAGWNGYLLFTNRTDPVIGWMILGVSVGVLVWNVSVLRAHRPGPAAVVVLFIAVAVMAAVVGSLAGVGPFSQDGSWRAPGLLGFPSRYDVDVVPGQFATIDDWLITLDGGGWEGGTVHVELTITNLGSRRSFGGSGPSLVAIDSTGKEVEPWIPEYSWGDLADAIKTGKELQFSPAYHGEYYPGEKWSGAAKFEMSPYSGRTGLYIWHFGYPRRHYLFDLGEPARSEFQPQIAPSSLQGAILGKWRHGLPEQCPPSMDPRAYAKLKELPENKTYFLDFTNDGNVAYADDGDTLVNGTYRFVGDRHVEISWSVSLGTTAQPFLRQRGVYEVGVSGERMYLRNERGTEASYRRAS